MIGVLRLLPVREPAFLGRLRTGAVILVLRAGAIASKFGLTLFIAHFLDLETLGIYGLMTGAVVVVPILIGQGVLGTLGRNSVDQSLTDLLADFAPYWAFLTVTYLAVIAMSFPLICQYLLPHLVLLVGILIFIEHLNGDILVILNHRQRPEFANRLLVIRTAAWIVCYTGLAYYIPGMRTLTVLLTFWLAGAGVALACFVWDCRNWPWHVAYAQFRDTKALACLIGRSRTLYLNEMTNTGSQYLDRYLVGAMLGLELAGVYFLFWSFANALSNVISTSLLQVQQPAIIMSRPNPEEQRRLLGALRVEAAVASLALGLVTACLAYVGLVLYPRPIFSSQRFVLLVLLLGFLVRMAYEVEGIGLYTRHEDRNTLFSALLVLVLSVAVTLSATPFLGLLGPASAVVVSYVTGVWWRLDRNKKAYAGSTIRSPPGMSS
ncbi:hypothetical protein AFCDBAGC_4847 [Methylobacterium cerastii]|uniref:Polysaccharide biosynthesis protein n=1 Tax=Methylobacterium cerastii TaxID=932741 RepID=A0ABQ4QNY6_9HYPH|nr:hypothetical protein AFCDBAGC_4847 [Methylobacterium cerastii]